MIMIILLKVLVYCLKKGPNIVSLFLHCEGGGFTAGGGNFLHLNSSYCNSFNFENVMTPPHCGVEFGVECSQKN